MTYTIDDFTQALGTVGMVPATPAYKRGKHGKIYHYEAKPEPSYFPTLAGTEIRLRYAKREFPEASILLPTGLKDVRDAAIRKLADKLGVDEAPLYCVQTDVFQAGAAIIIFEFDHYLLEGGLLMRDDEAAGKQYPTAYEILSITDVRKLVLEAIVSQMREPTPERLRAYISQLKQEEIKTVHTLEYIGAAVTQTMMLMMSEVSLIHRSTTDIFQDTPQTGNGAGTSGNQP